MLRTAANTLTHLLAIIGTGFLLASGHVYVRSAWMDRPAVSVTRTAPSRTAQPVGPNQATPAPDPAPDPTPDLAADPPSWARSTERGSSDSSDPVVFEPAAQPSPLDAPVKPGSINLREAHDLHEQGAFFLDARYEEDFKAGRIGGAFWMPASRVPTDEGRTDLEIIPPGGTVVIYCTGGDCDASENTANRIELMGYTFDIRILGKGYADWLEAGLPTESGEVQP